MKTFVEVNKKPEVGMVCYNPTSKLKSIIFHMSQDVRYSTGEVTNFVHIFNERGKSQKIEKEYFAERYFYQGESIEDVDMFFFTGKDQNKSGKSYSKLKRDPKVNDLIVTPSGTLAVVTAVCDEVYYGEKTGNTVVRFINERGTTVTRELESFCKKHVFKGKSLVNLKTIFMTKSPVKSWLFKLLKMEFRTKG